MLSYDAKAVARLEKLYSSPQIVDQRRRLRAIVGARPGERGLDVGCGVAYLACELANDPFAPQYLRDAATRLRNRYGVAVLVWPDGVAAIVSGEQTREAVIQAYWKAINRFVGSYIAPELPQSGTEDVTAQPRKKRRYTKRKVTGNTPLTERKKSVNANATSSPEGKT